MASPLRRIRLTTLGVSVVLLALLLTGAMVVGRVLSDGRAQREAMDGSHRLVAGLLEMRNTLFEIVVERNLILSRNPASSRATYESNPARLSERLETLKELAADSPLQAAAAAELGEALDLFVARLNGTLARDLGEGMDRRCCCARPAASATA
ncbi:hypothetical protein [Teichococcus aestuarii]|uniref:hypothetical protein n=1 Tax=Teichococcus aestuarii TaxID=568898 RepID=UPI00360E09C9